MSQTRSLTCPSEVRYLYDGSLAGFYCCVYESVYAHELPCEILRYDEAEATMLPEKFIPTDPARSQRVRRSVTAKISPRALSLVETVFLSCLPFKELHILRFLLYGYEEKYDVSQRISDPEVSVLLDAEKHLLGERHLLLGFIRFSDYDGLLGATITPKNFVLPFLRGHFIGRFPNEDFVIVDKTHQHALIYQDKVCEIIPVDDVAFPEPNEQEMEFRRLWKQFYKTIAIESRRNERCRMTHMPKRYWENMLEVSDLLERVK